MKLADCGQERVQTTQTDRNRACDSKHFNGTRHALYTGVKLRIAFYLFLLALVTGAFAEQTIARYLDLPPEASPKVMAADSSGNLFIASSLLAPSGLYQARILKTGTDGRTLASMDLNMSSITAAAVTPKGNLLIAGGSWSTDFPLVSPVITKAGPNSALLVEIDSQLRNIVFSTRLGGTTGQGPGHGGTSIGALAVDPAGNIYATGSTADTDFPLTPGAFQTQPPTGGPWGTAGFAFLTEISADRKRLVFSTYFGGGAVLCNGGSHCIGVYAFTRGIALGIDSDGDITIAGPTDANDLPVTPGVLAPQCLCTSDAHGAFAARFKAGGSSLKWATYVPLGSSQFLPSTVSSMALDSSGNVVLAGITPTGFPVTPGAAQMNVPEPYSLSGFVAKLDSLGQRFLFATYFGAGTEGQQPEVPGMALDGQGAIWITGTSDPKALPHATAPFFGTAYVASLSADGSSVKAVVTAPEGAAGRALTVTPDGSVIALGSANSMLVTTPAAGPSLIAVTNSAAPQVSNVAVPYELISLYGIGLGPATPMNAQVVNGVVTTALDGVQVLFDGTPAPLLYAGPNQINAVVPREVWGRDTTALQVVTPTGTLQGPTMSIRSSDPAVFLIAGSNGVAAALNQDGSLNSEANPAAPGSVVSVWATGAGFLYFGRIDGAIVTDIPSPVLLPVSVLANPAKGGTYSLEILYAGDAPELVAGVVQVNFRLPGQVPPNGANLELQVGDVISPRFSVYVR